VKRIFPEVLEEISGFAQAYELPYERFAAFMFGIGAFKPQPDCSLFAAANGSGVLFGHNCDFFYSFKYYTESTLTLPENGYFSIGQSDVLIGKEDGMNEKGLAVAMTGVESPIIKPGISFCLAVRCILDKCSTTAEAVRILSEAKLTSANNFLIADKTGELAVVEASPTRLRVRKPEVGQLRCLHEPLRPSRYARNRKHGGKKEIELGHTSKICSDLKRAQKCRRNLQLERRTEDSV
jgi:predicted choloylglycine hydrolase